MMSFIVFFRLHHHTIVGAPTKVWQSLATQGGQQGLDYHPKLNNVLRCQDVVLHQSTASAPASVGSSGLSSAILNREFVI